MNRQSQWLFEVPFVSESDRHTNPYTNPEYYSDSEVVKPRVSTQEEIAWEKANPTGQIGEKRAGGVRVFILWNFAVGSAALKTIHRSFLDDLAKGFKSMSARDPFVSLSIEGHSSNTDTAVRNRRVSEQRANTVRAYLIGKGLSSRRVITSASGFSNPSMPNTTPENMAMNRRVEITLAFTA